MRQRRALLDQLGLAEGNHVIASGIRRAVMGLAVEVLRFEKQHGIVAADGGAQQAVGVQRGRGHHHPQARQVGKDGFAGLAVIDRASRQVTSDGRRG